MLVSSLVLISRLDDVLVRMDQDDTLQDPPSKHRSRPSSPNSLSEGARVHENSRLNSYPHTPVAAKECADIRDLDMAEVQLTEHLCDDSVTTVTEDTEAADGNTNLRGDLRLYDDTERVEQQPSTTHCVEFDIGQFTHFTHDTPPYPEMFAGISATLTLGG